MTATDAKKLLETEAALEASMPSAHLSKRSFMILKMYDWHGRKDRTVKKMKVASPMLKAQLKKLDAAVEERRSIQKDRIAREAVRSCSF